MTPKVNLKRGESYIDCTSWIKPRKAIINLINGDDKCFQYAAKVTLNTVTKFEKSRKKYHELNLL